MLALHNRHSESHLIPHPANHINHIFFLALEDAFKREERKEQNHISFHSFLPSKSVSNTYFFNKVKVKLISKKKTYKM